MRSTSLSANCVCATLPAIENDTASSTIANWMLIRRDGTEIAIQDSAAPIHDRSGHTVGAVMVFRDVSALRATSLKMTYLAQHDALTGLPNRIALNDRLGQAIGLARRHERQFALLFVDVDRFKLVNDAYGHPVGDHFLISIAKRLQSCVRSTDTVSRVGGDEFVVLITEMAHSADSVMCARKIVSALSLPYDIERHHLHLTASVGVGIYPEDGRDAEALLRNADSAMFRAKKNGGHRIQLCMPSGTAGALAGSLHKTILNRRPFGFLWK